MQQPDAQANIAHGARQVITAYPLAAGLTQVDDGESCLLVRCWAAVGGSDAALGARVPGSEKGGSRVRRQAERMGGSLELP